jgi:hypothetical protein
VPRRGIDLLACLSRVLSCYSTLPHILCCPAPSESPFPSSRNTVIPSTQIRPANLRGALYLTPTVHPCLSSVYQPALTLAGEHETRLTAPKMSKYRETILLGSASSWNRTLLDDFNVDFQECQNTPLDRLIASKWYDWSGEGDEFADCNTCASVF